MSGTTFSPNFSCKVSEKRAAHRRPRNDPKLYQILLRSIPVLSGEAGGFAGVDRSLASNEVLYCRPRHPRGGLWRQYAGHQSHLGEYRVSGIAASGATRSLSAEQAIKEIDFVCDKRGEKLYVQVTYLLASEETVNREFGAYDTIRDNFPKYVVSLDEFDMSRNGIKHRNIRDFLLSEEWN